MKKSLFITVTPNRKKSGGGFMVWMKRNFISFSICLSFIPGFIHAQSVGNWTFNNTLTGTPGSQNTTSAASLGSSITLGAYNGGTVYFGEGGWPSGAIDPNAYLQISLTPNSGYTLSISSLVMNLRRSTTGTAAGSGPNNWALRSSLDGYTTDISNGVLTLTSATAITVALPGAFTGLSSAVTFRLYGYNATVSTGGLSRFVYDNITANGSIILPIVVEDFKAAVVNDNAVQLAWTLDVDESINELQVERSSNESDFTVIKNIFPGQNAQLNQFVFVDEPVLNEHTDFYYRIKIIAYTGKTYYSPIQKISFTGKNNFSINALPAHQGENIKCNIKTDKAANCQFSLYSMNGARIASRSIALGEGNQLITMDNGSLVPGIYVLVAERTGKKTSSKIIVQ